MPIQKSFKFVNILSDVFLNVIADIKSPEAYILTFHQEQVTGHNAAIV